MSLGSSLLRAIIEDGSKSVFMDLIEDLFIQDEIEAYEFINSHVRRHGTLPTTDTLQENGINLTQRREPVSYYLDKVRERAKYNDLANLSTELRESLRTRDVQRSEELVRTVPARLGRYDLSQQSLSLNSAFERMVEEYNVVKRIEGLRGTTMGYNCVDAITDGAHGGDIHILAARPNVGKSFLLCHMATQAWLAGRSVVFASMEMSTQQVARRLMGIYGGVHPDYIRSGRLSHFGEEQMQSAIADTSTKSPFTLISGELRKSVGQIDAAIQEYSPDIVYVDAAYLLSPDKSKLKDRREKISEVAEELKMLAMDRNIPIIITVQLNRQAQHKGRKKLEIDLSNLAETDVLGQIATTAMLVYPAPAPHDKTKRIVYVAKNRDGPLMKFATHFLFNPLNFSFSHEVDDDEDQGGESTETFGDGWE